MVNMRIVQKVSTLALAILISSSVYAYKYVGSAPTDGPGLTTNNGNGQQEGEVRAASCAPATALLDLEWNNVRATIETGGNMWQNRADGTSAYEVPKGGGVSAIYAGGLWMGGRSLDQTLKLAAVKFRAAGNDYWTGPLTNDGTAEVTAETCIEYDKFSVSLKEDAVRHNTYWELVISGATADQIAEVFPDGYTMPSYFLTYPAHGNTAAGQDFYLAPFKDFNTNGVYEPELGDYPFYDYKREIDCAQRRREDQVPLFGDQTYYWIFNDKGNIHTESQGLPIGMEVRAQAFAFTTNDEVNNMTFLNYVLINQGSQTLTETYFGSWVDPDMGFANDDYVGCDVQRGLGYCYNGDAFDEAGTGSLGYGANPPAVGVDFFEGPYQDSDSLANPLTGDILAAIDSLGIPYKGLGIGYGDSIVDNERFGMRRFVYYLNDNNQIYGEPNVPQHYYNYMRGIWKNGLEMLFGGNGANSSGVISGLNAQYMFPGDTDPLNWSTYGVPPPASAIPWTEQTAGNQLGDRRFIQSAGPFTLEPGDYNNITLGVVWARAIGGDPYESVGLLRLADDKAQSLFDNCFELVNGPDAPDVAVQELDREIILMLSNNNPASNNYREEYSEFDPSIPDSYSELERSYRFEGYLVYQLLNDEVSNADLGEITKARLIAQCDLQNDVANIINYSRDQTTGLIGASLMVQGENLGVQTSFRITTDAFALGSNALINHKTYYFMVVAYGYNNYEPYDIAFGTGQDDVFKASRKSAVGAVQRIAAIPHNVSPEAGGTIANSEYGSGVPITRVEGTGNGTNLLALSSATESALMNAPYTADLAEYVPGAGPVSIKIVDPLRVQPADFKLYLRDTSETVDQDYQPEFMYWVLENETTGEMDSSYRSFATLSEDLILDYGFSISWGQYQYFNEDGEVIEHYTDLLDAELEFADPLNPWLAGIPDVDGFTELNWIRSGSIETADDTPEEEAIYSDYNDGSAGAPFTDAGEVYEKVLGGTWSPYCLAGYSAELSTGEWRNIAAPVSEDIKGDLSPSLEQKHIANIKGLNNVDIVFTSDKSKWTRSVVLEMQSITEIAEDQFNEAFGEPEKMRPRRARSVDKNGRSSEQAGYNAAEGDLVSNWGMGWFPGYAIDITTGERLNIAFGEDSWLVGENGDDMVWNPSARLYGSDGQALFGGQHWIYVFKNLRAESFYDPNDLLDVQTDFCPRYDQGAFLFNRLSSNVSFGDLKKVYRACTWVGSALGVGLTSAEQGIVPNEARVRLRVAKQYKKYDPQGSALEVFDGSSNDWNNLYTFSTKSAAPVTGSTETLETALDIINVVPNPYYAFSTYETNKLDNRIKITNLPYECTVSIYDLNGTMIRQFKKGDPTTSLDWDLKNQKNIPIASGTYIIHVNVPNVGEKILKWFGVMRPIDLDSF
jgi:hypothetical protein